MREFSIITRRTIPLILLACAALILVASLGSQEPLAPTVATSTQPSAATSALEEPLESVPPSDFIAEVREMPRPEIRLNEATESSSPATQEVERSEAPYDTPPLPFSEVNTVARAALVNILCAATSGTMSPISGSGVIVDPRGIVLTNAHVAQYVLLSESHRIDMKCTVRTGAPATARWTPRVMYIPPVWIELHANDIRNQKPVGTGEHDYALLYIGQPVDAKPRPTIFPFLSPDTREAVAFTGDQILVAAYPAEFFGGAITHFNLYPASSVTTVGQLYTFDSGSVDAFSLGGVIAAQSGSSGGGAVNAWGRLVGILTTTSDGATTAERDLRAISLASIDRDITAQTGQSLTTLLSQDPAAFANSFLTSTAPTLIETLLGALRSH